MLALDVYDGVETGVAAWRSGEGFFFEAIGDSRAPAYRAYAFIKLEGDWLSRIAAFPENLFVPSISKFMMSREPSPLFDSLAADLAEIKKESKYLGIAHVYMDCFCLLPIEATNINELRRSDSRATFQKIHRLIKAR